jgi:lipoate-protein ligase A
MEVYKLISEALSAGLNKLAGGVQMARSQPDFRKLYRQPGSVPCFSSSARYEIEFNGKKFVGSAQRRIGRTVLQHGSILIGSAHLHLSDYLAMDSQQANLLRKDLERQTTTLNDILGRTVVYEEVRDAVRQGFEKQWDLRFTQPAQEFAEFHSERTL